MIEDTISTWIEIALASGNEISNHVRRTASIDNFFVRMPKLLNLKLVETAGFKIYPNILNWLEEN